MSDYQLPLELWIEEILTRLLVKNLLRCTSVCKSWYSLITSPSFITSHLNRTIANKHTRTPFVVRNYNDHMEQYYVHTDNETFDKCENLNFPFPFRFPCFNIVGTCNGLVFLSDDPGLHYMDTMILWNPSIQNFLYLPYPNVAYRTHGSLWHTLGFGFNPVTNDYNVVRIFYLHKYERRVWVLEFPPMVELYELSTGTWRNVGTVDFSYDIIKEHSPQVVLNGVVHWVGHTRKKGRNLIVSFDFKNETFGIVRVPRDAKKGGNLCVTLFGESLSFVDERISANESYCYIWVMKEYGVEHTWTRQFKIDLTPKDFRRLDGRLSGIYDFRNNGDVLLAEIGTDSRDLVSYNPESKIFKKLGIRGLSSFFLCQHLHGEPSPN